MALELNKVIEQVEHMLNENHEIQSNISWYQRTWQCSYVWVASIFSTDEMSFEKFLASIYKNDPTNPTFSVENWLCESRVEEANKSDLEHLLSDMQSDLLFKAELEGGYSIHPHFPLGDWCLKSLWEIYKISGAYKHGKVSTTMYVWQSGDWLHYCEIHHES